MYDPYEDFSKLREFFVGTIKPVVVYIFSMSPEMWEEEIVHISTQISVETIPDEILQTYKKIFGF